MDREALAYRISEILLNRLRPEPPRAVVEAVVADLVRLLERQPAGPEPAAPPPRLAVLTVLGRNRKGIVHAFSEVLAEHGVDIVDINQTLVHGNFAMMMVVDPSGADVDLAGLKALLKPRAEALGVGVFLQYEDLLRAVNRV